jgi:hypothetical protein
MYIFDNCQSLVSPAILIFKSQFAPPPVAPDVLMPFTIVPSEVLDTKFLPHVTAQFVFGEIE